MTVESILERDWSLAIAVFYNVVNCPLSSLYTVGKVSLLQITVKQYNPPPEGRKRNFTTFSAKHETFNDNIKCYQNCDLVQALV